MHKSEERVVVEIWHSIIEHVYLKIGLLCKIVRMYLNDHIIEYQLDTFQHTLQLNYSQLQKNRVP